MKSRLIFGLVCFQLVLQTTSLCRSNSYLQRRPKQSIQSRTQYKLPLFASAGAFTSLDKDGNGRLSMFEIMSSPKEIITHSPLSTALFGRLKTMLSGDTTRERVLLQKLGNLISIPDAMIMLTLVYFYKPVLKAIYRMIHFRTPEVTRIPYPKSLIGHLEGPVGYLVWFPPFLYTIDFLSIFIQYLGLGTLIKGDISRLACSIGAAVVAGSFMTRIKDWICYRWRNNNNLDSNKTTGGAHTRDVGKDKITDELTSTIIWLMVVAFSLEVASSELGVGLGSLFALGGIGSASFVLALRSSMENLVGGLLLKLQDKFRVGEKVTFPGSNEEGLVEEIGFLSTKLRKDDDSHLTVPNAQFIQGEVINWSRTPYRLFKTVITVKESNISLLPSIIQSIKETLREDDGVESQQRDLIVSATGFNSGSAVVVEINARLKGNNDHEISLVKTRVVDKIASSVDAIYNARGKLYA